MKKKFVSVGISFIVFVTLISSTTLAIATMGLTIPPTPGYVQSKDDLPSMVTHPHQTFPFNRQFTTTAFDIVDVLEQINEPLLRGYDEDLVNFGPRVTGTPACDQAAVYLYNEFTSMGLPTRYHNWSYSGYKGSNVEATLQGDDDNIFIICAHYDTVETSPGADDDGSGTAAVLAAASILRNYPMEHTIRFVAFSGEEQGLLGSHEYAKDAASQGTPIIAVLNADMIAFAITTDDGNKVQIFENDESEWIVDYTIDISQVYAPYIGLTVLPQGETWGSDHYYFWQYGYDAVFYFEQHFNEYYHSSQDTMEHMNFTYYVKTSRLIIGTLAALCQQPTPRLQIGDITGGFEVNAQILNIGDITAENVNWSIRVTGGLLKLINRENSDTFDSLSSGAMENGTLRPVIGFGPVSINVSADSALTTKVYKDVDGFVLFMYVVVRS